MKNSSIKRPQAGFISFLLVLATGAILTALTFAAYRRALGAQVTQSRVQLRTDYAEREEAILRSIVAITPNRAIRAMKGGSDVDNVRIPLGWKGIFTDALAVANSRTSISPAMIASLNIPNLRSAINGDGAMDEVGAIFRPIVSDPSATAMPVVTAGLNQAISGAYPPPLASADGRTSERDVAYPIISNLKRYDATAQSYLNSAALNGNASGAYGVAVTADSKFNRLKYPAINFGYAKPGDPFIAKRNWWAFSLNVSDHDSVLRPDSPNRAPTGIVRPPRNFVLSIYEVPSQLAISAAAAMSLGQYASGAAWQNCVIEGGISLGRATVTGNRALDTLALRRGIGNMAQAGRVGEELIADPFAVGVREEYQHRRDGSISLANQATQGGYFPVSLASESGRVAFIPINRGSAFFDRFDYEGAERQNDPIVGARTGDHGAQDALSTTSWNNYSIGAQQCAMRLDITACAPDASPTNLRFQFKSRLAGGERIERPILLGRSASGVITELPPGYIEAGVSENGLPMTFDTSTDIAYGAPGGFVIWYGAQGPINFNNATFGDPLPGVYKRGYKRDSGGGAVLTPFGQHISVNGQPCIVVYPERLRLYLLANGGADLSINNSLSVNVDYSATGFGDRDKKPSIPCHPTGPTDPLRDYGLVLKGARDLTTFPRGFSLVTNLRLFIGEEFNQTPTVPGGLVFPPCSIFAPEKRWGADAALVGAAPRPIVHRGQVGSLAKIDQVLATDVIPEIRPLDAKRLGGDSAAAANITTSLTQVRTPAQLPPITMMNWLVLLEEVR